MKTIKFIILGALLSVMGVATAEQVPGSETFKLLDTDGDGSISIVEATGHETLLINWANIDTDEDGMVETSEFSAFEAEQVIDYYDPLIDAIPRSGSIPVK